MKTQGEIEAAVSAGVARFEVLLFTLVEAPLFREA
jgi:hypothetical protein